MTTQANDPAEFLPRRRPSQERSRRRFDDILRAARALLVEVGFESFTSEQVALRAGVPIGSLYQFFGNKYAIICELDRLDTVNVQAELEKFAGEIPSLDWVELLDKLLDHLAALWRTDPSRRAVWLAMQATPPTRAIAAEHERDLASQVTRLLAPLTPGSKISDRQTIAEVLVHVTYSMLNFSIRDGQSHPDAVVQLKTLLTGYLLAAEAESQPRSAPRPEPGAPPGRCWVVAGSLLGRCWVVAGSLLGLDSSSPLGVLPANGRSGEYADSLRAPKGVWPTRARARPDARGRTRAGRSVAV